MPSVACVIKTPAVSKTQFPDVAPVRLAVPMIRASDARMLALVSYQTPFNHDIDDLIDTAIYSYAGDLYQLIAAVDVLTPLATGEFIEGGLAFTIDRGKAVASAYANGIQGAADLAAISLAETPFLSQDYALGRLSAIPYLLITHKMHNVLDRPYHELILSVEKCARDVSAEGVQCSRWPIWEYEQALADMAGRLKKIESLVTSQEQTVQGEVAMFTLVHQVELMHSARDLPALQEAFNRLPALPGIDTSEPGSRFG
ncbi:MULTISPECIES: hypothetical protein [Pseudomonas]|uniref:Uncharacterized protein n=1 Tax=Pseudomonas fluorescens TaxID=294 RepID=A0A161Z9P4_PSEFL|nr:MULTISPECIES: hypothetical protein [Pseudomonas]KZN20437.1 hypothetical protein A1D17_02540 [Pseudomonas fluorescens]